MDDENSDSGSTGVELEADQKKESVTEEKELEEIDTQEPQKDVRSFSAPSQIS